MVVSFIMWYKHLYYVPETLMLLLKIYWKWFDVNFHGDRGEEHHLEQGHIYELLWNNELVPLCQVSFGFGFRCSITWGGKNAFY